MSIANLAESYYNAGLDITRLNLEITELQASKNLLVYKQADLQNLQNDEKSEIRNYFKAYFEENPELDEDYRDYTELPDYEEEINKITAKYEDELSEINAYETSIDNQITTDSAELEEVTAYKESIKSMLSSNIQEDFNYGLNG